MTYNLKWNKFFEIVIIFLALIIILLKQSDIAIKERPTFLNNYSLNYFYFIILYSSFFLDYFLLKKLKIFKACINGSNAFNAL